MSTNFKISKHRNGQNLHLKLSGDFDDVSALQLLSELNNGHSGIYRIIVHTSSLDSLHCSNRTIFTKYLDEISSQPCRIMFTGEYADQIV